MTHSSGTVGAVVTCQAVIVGFTKNWFQVRPEIIWAGACSAAVDSGFIILRCIQSSSGLSFTRDMQLGNFKTASASIKNHFYCSYLGIKKTIMGGVKSNNVVSITARVGTEEEGIPFTSEYRCISVFPSTCNSEPVLAGSYEFHASSS